MQALRLKMYQMSSGTAGCFSVFADMVLGRQPSDDHHPAPQSQDDTRDVSGRRLSTIPAQFQTHGH